MASLSDLPQPKTSIPVNNPNNPIVFFDVTIGGADAGRIKFELFADTTPKTAENFRQFCTGRWIVQHTSYIYPYIPTNPCNYIYIHNLSPIEVF